MGQYSIAILPSEEIILEIRALKKMLEARIGWFHSVNSDAHITFNIFNGGDATFRVWEQYTEDFASRVAAFPFCMNRTECFSNGAFVLLPDEESSAMLIPLMKSFYRNAPGAYFGKSYRPHISIGRKLNAEQLSTASELIHTVSLRFLCDNITIRRFNEERQQYDLYKKYSFSTL